MQLNVILALLATVSAGTAVSLPPTGERQANGLYRTFVDESGNTTTEFIPASDLAGSATDISNVAVEARSEIAKRREGCGGGVSTADSDEANKRLLDFLSNLDNVRLGQRERVSVSTLARPKSNLYKVNNRPAFRIHHAALKGSFKLILLQYTYNSATSFICPYSGGFKWKSDIAGNWNWIKTTLCGLNRGGYAQIVGGEGDWTSGYTWNGDGYCW